MSVFFIVPAHGRLKLAAVCLRQLRRTCDTLTEEGIDASAVVIACDENLDVAREVGFATVERDNAQLGRKFNDGFELAARAGVTHLVPCGSDDWIDPAWVLTAPTSDTAVVCPRLCSMVNEDASRMMRVRVGYDGGLGLRITPVGLLERLAFRPVDEDLNRGIDTSALMRLRGAHGGLDLVYHDLHGCQIVDWKSDGANLNTFEMCRPHQEGDEITDPFTRLADCFPAVALQEMAVTYGQQLEVAA